ncbi:MAG: BREX system Lon protease-like protein BrxL [Desulfurococcaceae archaeon]
MSSITESIIEKYLVPRDQSFFNNRLYELGYSELAKYKLYIDRRVEFISKPISVSFTPEYMILAFPNGIKARMNYSAIRHNSDYFYTILRTYNKWRIYLYNEPMVHTYEETSIEPAYDIADNILKNTMPLEAIVRGMGYEPKDLVYRLLIPRILPLIKTPNPIHVWQYTKYNSGKTHYGLYVMKVFRYFYSTAVPSQAGLLYDARTGTYGWAMLSDGIVFDEVDKWSIDVMKSNELLSYMPTLMEQGVIVRPTTRHTFLGIIERKIPFIFMGNVPPLYDDISCYKMSDRDILQDHLRTWGDSVGAISDRITLIDIDYSTPLISDYVTDKILPESVMLALVDLINKDAVSISRPASSLSGRLKRHSEMLYIALTAIGFETTIEDCDDIVLNGWRTWLRKNAEK